MNHDLNLNSQLGRSSIFPEKCPSLADSSRVEGSRVPPSCSSSFKLQEFTLLLNLLRQESFVFRPTVPSSQATLVEPCLLIQLLVPSEPRFTPADSQKTRSATVMKKFVGWLTVNVLKTL